MKPTALLALGLAAGAIGRYASRRRREIDAVDPELRGPGLWPPLAVGDRATLTLLRNLPLPRPAGPDLGVRRDRRTAPRSDGGSPIELVAFEPAERDRRSPAVLWLHGGGTIMGTPEQSAPICERIAAEVGALVVAPDYRLAPDHPFPAGLDDCFATLQWLHTNADSLGIDPDRIAVGGESAGGGLAAALAQRAHDAGGPPIAYQALIYPMIDDRTVLVDDHSGRGNFVWTPTSNAYAWTSYLGRPPRADEAPEYAAAARRTDLTGLPPAWIGVGDLDLFFDEDVDYARRLQDAGVPVELIIEAGMYHGADDFVPNAPTMIDFRQSMIAGLRTALTGRIETDPGSTGEAR
ncbi:alpha/beta hydrolase [Naumannella huperziae]